MAALVLAVACEAAPAPIPTIEHAAGIERAASIERANTPELFAIGEGRLVSLTVQNLGTMAWDANGPVSVSYHWEGPDPVWDGERTPFSVRVEPGEVAEVVARVVAPPTEGEYTLVWDVVDDRTAWFAAEGPAVRAQVSVRPPEARAEWGDMSAGALHADVLTTIKVAVRNVGTVQWPSAGEGQVLLSYHWRRPDGSVYRWDGLRTPLERAVAPGETFETEMLLMPPGTQGHYVLELDLVREGVSWFGNAATFAVGVAPASFAYELKVISAPSRVALGQPVEMTLGLTNRGDAPWPYGGDRRLRLAYHLVDATGRQVLWDGPRTDPPQLVAPGETIEIQPIVRAPEEPGRHTFRFDMVQEGVVWLGARGNASLEVAVDVAALDYKTRFESTQGPETMATGVTYTVTAVVRNLGEVPVPKGGHRPVMVGYHWLDERGGIVLWDSPRVELPDDIAPGESVEVSLEVTPPKRAGQYVLALDLVREGDTWYSQHGAAPGRLAIRVAEPSFNATWLEVRVASTLRAGSIATIQVRVRNDGALPWEAGGDIAIMLAHHWRAEDGSLLVWDGFRTELPRDVAPGETIEVEGFVFAPVTPGSYTLEVDLVQESVAWFGEKGNPVARRTVEVVD